ncbi:FAD-binding domain-containing protein [Gigaspora margarita]|uniref:FAD-binding domain-containing protein n=1 Tax=Gigaspora margarita TaxID=4874 RepID=A0A8H4ETB9_GIGMA|nr:FAD-binding domain-containing protein [Gigaspora margarita]
MHLHILDINLEFNKRIIHFPVAFVHPINEIDGHSSEGYGLGDKDYYLVVDLRTLKKITVNITSQTAVVGTGNTLGSLYKEMQQYIFAFPAGVNPSVRVGRHMPGLGLLNRRFGTSSDNILDAQIVLANDTVGSKSVSYIENEFYNLILNNKEENNNSKGNETFEDFKLKSFFINSPGLSYE